MEPVDWVELWSPLIHSPWANWMELLPHAWRRKSLKNLKKGRAWRRKSLKNVIQPSWRILKYFENLKNSWEGKYILGMHVGAFWVGSRGCWISQLLYIKYQYVFPRSIQTQKNMQVAPIKSPQWSAYRGAKQQGLSTVPHFGWVLNQSTTHCYFGDGDEHPYHQNSNA